MQNKPNDGPRESATSVTLAVDRDAVFTIVKQRIDAACAQLDFLVGKYAQSGLDGVTKLARIETLRAKADYLRGLPLNPNAHPWIEDD